MLKSYKYRIYPTPAQQVLINRHIGSVRFVYNLALEVKQAAWISNRVNLNCFALNAQLPELKKECGWLKEINAQSLQCAVRNLDNAFTRFFKGSAGFPNFKKKQNGGSFTIPQKVKLIDGRVSFPKFKEGLRVVEHRPIKGEIKHGVVRRTPTGKYFIALVCETGDMPDTLKVVDESTTVGVDLGVKSFAVISDGKTYSNPKFAKRLLSRLKYVQRRFRKHNGKRTRIRFSLLHEKVANQRKDFLHKVSTELIKNHDSLAIETLQVANMLKVPNLAAVIQDAGWGMFVEMLEYKAKWYGKNILRIGTFEPSSKTCSVCGRINKELVLQDRVWTCKVCGSILDRDVNASINIKTFALRNHVCGTQTKIQNELPTLVGVLTSETQ